MYVIEYYIGTLLYPWCCPAAVDEYKELMKGSFDTGNPLTTNLYVGNISPKVGCWVWAACSICVSVCVFVCFVCDVMWCCMCDGM